MPRIRDLYFSIRILLKKRFSCENQTNTVLRSEQINLPVTIQYPAGKKITKFQAGFCFKQP